MSLDARITEAHDLVDIALRDHVGSKRLAGIVTLFSGGNDSTVLAHLMRERATHHGHCNTTIGIEETRVFVRKTSEAFGVELLERTPPAGSHYRDLVIGHGFPGPAHHFKMYQRLKERGLRQIRKHLVGTRTRSSRVVFLAGRRRAESVRRMNVPEMEVQGSTVWCSPLVNWTTEDMNAYRTRHPELPRNEVSDNIHMSGECLCGAFATQNELVEIAFFYPDMAAEITELEREVRAAGLPPQRCTWGWGATRDRYKDELVAMDEVLFGGPLCSSCEFRHEGQ